MSRFWDFVETLRNWRIDNDVVIHPLPPSTPIITVLPIVDDPDKDVIFAEENESKRKNTDQQEPNILVRIIIYL